MLKWLVITCLSIALCACGSSSKTTAARPPWPDDRPELDPLLPILYVVWADGSLTADELERVRWCR